MKRFLIVLSGMLMIIGTFACNKVSNNVGNNAPIDIQIDTENPDDGDINVTTDVTNQSDDDISSVEVEDPLLRKYKDYLEFSSDKCVLFDMGFEHPVFIAIEGNYWLYGMDKDGNIEEIDSLVKDVHSAQHWLKEGEPILISFMTIGAGEAVSYHYYKIKDDFSVKELYEIREIYSTDGSERQYDENGNPLFDTEFYINGERQDIAPEEYEGYIPLDDSFIEIMELFDGGQNVEENEQAIKLYNYYDNIDKKNEDDLLKSVRRTVKDSSEEDDFIAEFLGGNDNTNVVENSVYKMVKKESLDTESIVFFIKGEESSYPEIAYGLQFNKSDAKDEAMLTDETDKDVFERICALDGSEYSMIDYLKPLTDYQDVNYIRDDNNKLINAEYSSDAAEHGTYNSSGTLYYDENERAVLRNYYVTSGSKYMAYVYDDDKLTMICEFGGMAYKGLDGNPEAEIGMDFCVYIMP